MIHSPGELETISEAETSEKEGISGARAEQTGASGASPGARVGPAMAVMGWGGDGTCGQGPAMRDTMLFTRGIRC